MNLNEQEDIVDNQVLQTTNNLSQTALDSITNINLAIESLTTATSILNTIKNLGKANKDIAKFTMESLEDMGLVELHTEEFTTNPTDVNYKYLEYQVSKVVKTQEDIATAQILEFITIHKEDANNLRNELLNKRIPYLSELLYANITATDVLLKAKIDRNGKIMINIKTEFFDVLSTPIEGLLDKVNNEHLRIINNTLPSINYPLISNDLATILNGSVPTVSDIVTFLNALYTNYTLDSLESNIVELTDCFNLEIDRIKCSSNTNVGWSEYGGVLSSSLLGINNISTTINALEVILLNVVPAIEFFKI